MLLLLALWDDVTSTTIGTTAEWSNKVEVADVDGDGWVDILFANGGDYFTAGTPEPERVFKNLGNWDAAGPHFEEITTDVFGAAGTRLSRVIKVRDVDGDGDQDIFVGGAHGTRSGLFLRGDGAWSDASAQLPAVDVTLGDAEFGDVDGDGDLDLVLADWGGDPQQVKGGATRLWLNDGDGTFTAGAFPDALVGMSWDLEVADVDDDADLDVLVSCKLCTGGKLFVNDGRGAFTEDSTRLPQRENNYEYEAMDIDGDGDLDLATINDGPQFKETVLVNDGTGHFTDATATALAGANNVSGADDNTDTFLDVDSDGDADFIIGSLSDADRLLRNDGHGVFTLDDTVMTLSTPGTLGLAVADLDQDRRLDVVQSQGEVTDADKVLRANSGVAVDAAAPAVRVLRGARVGDLRVVARVHDHKSPSAAHDWDEVVVEIGGEEVPMVWRGEYQWAAVLEGAAEGAEYRVCAADAAGNRACTDPSTVGAAGEPDAGTAPDAGDPGGDDDGGGGGGCCDAGASGGGSALLTLLALLGFSRRRRR